MFLIFYARKVQVLIFFRRNNHKIKIKEQIKNNNNVLL
jgi:hypothetical protein